ncbi:acetylxylan esterase [Arcanobacterium haemolyticum]|nr:acetylxylan esterase [Arcanobacterium haemolyticum]
MPFFDLAEDKLLTYKPDVREPEDFDAFWATTLQENAIDPTKITSTKLDSPLRAVDIVDVRFPGFGGDPIAAWLITPAGAKEPLPTIVQFIGYGGGRGFPEEHLVWPSAGCAIFVVDSRGQGGGFGSGGSTPDGGYAGGPASFGLLTRGIETPENYYFRRLFTDAHNAIDTAATFDCVDSRRMVCAGSSQGGALAIASAAMNSLVAGVLADVPFLCHVKRAIGLTGARPYDEIVRFLSVNRDLVPRVYETLSYFDIVNFGKRVGVDALFSTGLMDAVCPPSTVFAMKNWYGGQSTINVYPFNSHEGGGTYQIRKQVEWVHERFM